MKMVTTTDIKKYAIKANKTFFNDSLNLNAIQFKISSRMTKTLGVFKVRNGQQSITLSTLLFNQKEEWVTTLVHELVHAWQWQTGKPLDHGWSFKQKAREIYSIAPEVVITRTRTSDYIEKAVANRYQEFGRKQYAISKGNRVWFLRNLQGHDLTTLRARGYKVAQASKPAAVRHCKNVNKLFTANYYYAASIVDDLSQKHNIEWKEI
ncbi:MAG: SprT-like domain-containing protein [Actinobacteria bacterium]|nr:SprT-like domain-containing protein [Actinomycetota bacterium]